MGFAYKFHDANGTYFVTTAVVEWIYTFTRYQYCDIVSLGACRSRETSVLLELRGDPSEHLEEQCSGCFCGPAQNNSEA